MGLLIDGTWHNDWYDTKSTGGRFVRSSAQFRDAIRADGSTRFRPETGRYHLYVSLACPWASRTLIFRKLKGLEKEISLSVVDPFMGENGWAFGEATGCIPDTVNGTRFLHQIYTLAKRDYRGRVTVPVLWDKKLGTIVNNESSEIIRMLNREFDAFGHREIDFYPEQLRDGIDALNDVIYRNVNNGVYCCGFATTQEAYDEAVEGLFATLDDLEERLRGQRYLLGDRVTEADWRLFTTLVRFDAVYVLHFKCNVRRLIDYPNLWSYTRDLFQVPGVSETVNLDHIKQHYYRSHTSINPTQIIPKGPEIDFYESHGRQRLRSG